MNTTTQSQIARRTDAARRPRLARKSFRAASVHCSIAFNDNDNHARKGITLMNHFKTRLLAAGIALALLAGPPLSQAADKENKENKIKNPPVQKPPTPKPPQPQPNQDRRTPGQDRKAQDGLGQKGQDQKVQKTQDNQKKDALEKEPKGRDQTQQDRQGKDQKDQQGQKVQDQEKKEKARLDQDRPEKDQKGQNQKDQDRQSRQEVKLQKKDTADGGYVKTAPSGRVREKAERKADGEHTQQFSPTGRVEKEEVKKANGEKQMKEFDLGGKVKREEVVRPDGSKEVTNHQSDRDGNVRAKETVKYDVHQKVVSKTVVKTVNKTVIVNNYDRGRYGYVYHPRYAHPRFFVSWYDPFWYSPVGVLTFHPFRYTWGWGSVGWYGRYHGSYFSCYDVYPAPSYWVTDWLVADYCSDRYAASVSAAQAREDARLAREEAEKARSAAEEARDAAEIAEAKAAQAQAELRARNAEDRLARAQREEANAGKPNPNATPVDKDTKEALKNQIEKTIAEKKEFAEQAEKGATPVLPDVSKALADPNHIYPVSKTISVVAAKDSSPAGMLTEGDLLKLEPGQETILKDATENTFVTMRVMTSKGEEGEVTAGTLISVPIKDLQEFDSEFRAKLDEGLAEAEKNKDKFKQAAQQP